MITDFDILFVADARFEGGTSTAVAVEMRAAARAGMRCGLMTVKGPLLGLPFPMHPDIRSLLEDGVVERVDPSVPMRAGIVLIHHPTIMANRPSTPLRIETRALIMVLHHPMFDREGTRQYDLTAISRNCQDSFGLAPAFAPVSGVVRYSLPRTLPPQSSLLDQDWMNLIDLDDWPMRDARPIGTPIVIGRHSRPDRLKWPSKQEALWAYPANGERYHIRVLGADDYLEDMYGALPGNWELIPFAWTGIAEFLASLDFYVYYHDNKWSEAFGRTILEALAVGLVVILPPHFETIFGTAAIYAMPAHVEKVIDRFVNDPAAYAAQRTRARAFAVDMCSAEIYSGRIDRVRQAFDVPASQASAISAPLPTRNVLFASSNGIGVGHLAQQLAIARHLPLDLRSVFATMSYSMKAAVREGYQAHFLTYHRHLDAHSDDWNRTLAEEMFDLLAHLKPAVFAYDATAVFDGVVQALRMFPNTFSVWVRRPMWRESHRTFLEMSHHFDAIIEPAELAQDFDHGPTAAERGRVLLVPPVLHIEPDERMSRAAARAALDLPEDLLVIALQLGSGANFDMTPVRKAIIDAVLERPDTLLLDLRSPIAAEAAAAAPTHPRHRVAELFPSFRHSRAFDAAVTAAGYNAFHEQVLGAIPTLFVPNEADEMDLQLNRARWAELTGHGLLMRRDYDLAHVKAHVEQLLDANEHARIAGRCRAIEWENGAREIARYMEDHARLVRTDWDVTGRDKEH
nr:glycosyltransferase [uncultured Shinella sp.]